MFMIGSVSFRAEIVAKICALVAQKLTTFFVKFHPTGPSVTFKVTAGQVHCAK